MRGMVVAAQPEASEAGVLALRKGGNAIDAAIAAAFVQGVVDPLMTGIAGYGSMQIHMPRRGVHQHLTFYARAPMAAREDMWADAVVGQSRDGFVYLVKDHANEIGYLAPGTPGNLRGYTDALRDFGTMELADVLRPAIDLARDGFMVRPYVHYYWTLDQRSSGMLNPIDYLRFSRTGRETYCTPDGAPKKPGQIVKNPDMARSLERIARGGPEIFYGGEMAEEIVADFRRHGGLLSIEDLRGYQCRRSDPVWGSYRGYPVATLAPPGGGVSLLQILHVLERFDLAALDHNGAEHLRILAEAMKQAALDKDAHVGDPEFVDVPLDMLLSKQRAGGIADRIRAGVKVHVPRMPFEPQDTTHVTVMDEEGNAVSLTHTLGNPSGVITDGLGFMYNGLMNGFDPRPGRAGSIAPGKGRTSSQCPTIVFDRDGRPRIVLGAPGATAIVPALAQTISNILDFGMTTFEAVAAPRISVNSDTIDVSNRIPRYVTGALEAQGYPVARSYMSYAFAAVHAIGVVDGRMSGGADPQRDGVALSA
ncbi:gamma-glutamyltransferase [Roseomonas soli]|uniref:Glutathione hydrolase proenzyme n=2 Tax=Neoroseomonas soli TaxID=1081025 RepID=A0A9X9WR09_9PROT|nr:gamma-glutamyltransferase [Neoroseomonas soli]